MNQVNCMKSIVDVAEFVVRYFFSFGYAFWAFA